MNIRLIIKKCWFWFRPSLDFVVKIAPWKMFLEVWISCSFEICFSTWFSHDDFDSSRWNWSFVLGDASLLSDLLKFFPMSFPEGIAPTIYKILIHQNRENQTRTIYTPQKLPPNKHNHSSKYTKPYLLELDFAYNSKY